MNTSQVPQAWLVELRTLELQLTDFENAAYVVFTTLLVEAILAKGISLHTPMSLVHENFNRAKNRNAITTEKFYIRKNSLIDQRSVPNKLDIPHDIAPIELTMEELLLGNNKEWKGFIPLIREYLCDIGNETNIERFEPYFLLLERRARGELPTCAQWIRNFLERHPDNNELPKLSVNSTNDLLQLCDAIGMGKANCSSLLGSDVFLRNLENL
jgi:glutamate--cysteine ligase catalytic subunit